LAAAGGLSSRVVPDSNKAIDDRENKVYVLEGKSDGLIGEATTWRASSGETFAPPIKSLGRG